VPADPTWGGRPASRSPKTAKVDAFVTGRDDARLSVALPKDLHTRFKIACAQQRRPMRAVLVELLEAHFPAEGPPPPPAGDAE